MQKKLFVFSFIGLLIGGVAVAGNSMDESTSGFLTSLPPDAPVLCSPADKVIHSPDSITMIWNSQIHTEAYLMDVSTVDDYSELFVSETVTDTAFTLTGLEENSTYYWRVRPYNVAGVGLFSEDWSFTTSSPSAVDRKISSIPKRHALLPAYPNPFNPMITITYQLSEKADVSLVIHNSMGQSVRELVSDLRQAGEYEVTWDGRDNRGAAMASGLYICHFRTGNRVFTQKLLLMR